MKILHLYHDIMNLYGEYANISALERFIEKNAGICQTDRCSFDKKAELADYDFIYVGSGTERNQKLVMEDMKKYKSELENAINSGKVILMTGNSFEMLGKTVTDPEGTAYEGLGIFDFETTEQNKTRITADAVFTSDFSDKKLVGFINKCSSIKNISSPLFSILMGIGNNEAEKTEGIRKNNFFGTHLTGPVLIKNPYFLEYIASLLPGMEKADGSYLKYEKAGYEVTLSELTKRMNQ